MESPVEGSAISPFFHVFLIIDTHSYFQTMQKRFTACPHYNNTEEHNYRSSGYYFIFVAVSVGEISRTERERKTRNGSQQKKCRNGELENSSSSFGCAQLMNTYHAYATAPRRPANQRKCMNFFGITLSRFFSGVLRTI